MRENRPIRIIRKRDSAAIVEVSAQPKSHTAAPTEREIKSVVSGWVRDHQQRAEEFRRNFASLFQTT